MRKWLAAPCPKQKFAPPNRIVGFASITSHLVITGLDTNAVIHTAIRCSSGVNAGAAC